MLSSYLPIFRPVLFVVALGRFSAFSARSFLASRRSSFSFSIAAFSASCAAFCSAFLSVLFIQVATRESTSLSTI